MRTIPAEQIIRAVKNLCIRTNYFADEKIINKIKSARDAGLAAHVLDILAQNAQTAAEKQIPICQDTGMAVVFVKLGREVFVDGNLEGAINEGVRQGYKDGFLRKSVVNDPINRVNTGDNTPAVVHYEITEGDRLELTVAPKGFGSENMSRIKMLNPSDGIEGVKDFVIHTVKEAGANPCPPIIVGVGVGGTFEKAALMSKQALTRDIDQPNGDEFWAGIERQLLEEINSLNIGPAGFGGNTTALAVLINTYPTHIAGLPVAVNIGCHVTRHGRVVI